MSYFQKLTRSFTAIRNEFSMPESFRKGEAFEDYVRQVMFPADQYALVHRTHSYQSNRNDFVESSLLPDFLFRDLKSNRQFYVEVKFRSNLLNHKNQIEWCNRDQLKRYKSLDCRDMPVFVALGIGDNPKYPEAISLFPLDACNFTGLYPTFLDDFNFYIDRPVFPGYLWKL